MTSARGPADDTRQGGVALLQVAHREHDVGAAVGQDGGRLVPDAGVGARDDNDAAALVRHVALRPFAVLFVGRSHGPKILMRIRGRWDGMSGCEAHSPIRGSGT